MNRPYIKEYLYAAHLVDPLRGNKFSSKVQLEDLNRDLILSILKHNKIPLATLDKEAWKIFPLISESPEFKAQYEKERFSYTAKREEWARVRERFLKAGIESVLIKSVGAFPYESSNLDVLIKQGQREKAESILRDLDYIELRNVEEPYKTLFRTFKDGESISAIHLHNKVAWINPFHDEELIWNRYRKSPIDDLVDIPSQEDSVLILTAHWFYEDKEIKLADMMKIASCMKGELDWDYMAATAEKMGWLHGLYFGLLVQCFLEEKLYGESFLRDDRREKMKAALPMWMRAYFNKKVYSGEVFPPFRLPRIFGKSLHFLKTFKGHTTALSKKLYEMYHVAYGALFVILFKRFNVNIRYQPPMLISISGVDGCGKTTYGKALYDILVFFELRTSFVWSRVGSSSFLKPLAKIGKIIYNLRKGSLVPKHSENYEESEERRKVLFARSSILRILGLFMLLLEMLWQYSLKLRLLLLSKKVVICDRYIYDTLVDIITRYGMNLNSLEGRLFKKIIVACAPKPDIAYLLNVDLDDACSRKNIVGKERDLLKNQINRYKEIAPLFILDHIETDNKRGMADIKYKIIINSLRKYYDKWPKKQLSNNNSHVQNIEKNRIV